MGPVWHMGLRHLAHGVPHRSRNVMAGQVSAVLIAVVINIASAPLPPISCLLGA